MTLIRVVDFETTGKEPPAEVCEVGWCDVSADAKAVTGPPQSRLHGVSAMPPEVRAVHHITAAEVAGLPPFDAEAFRQESLAAGVIAFAAHKADFEAQWLVYRDLWLICTYKVALRLWPDAPEYKNATLRYWLEDAGKIAPEPALCMPPHRGGPDAYVTAHILAAAFATGATGKQMVAWSREPALLPSCPIGEHRGKPWSEVPFGFLDWMVRKAANMDDDTRWNAQRELDRRARG